MTYGNRQHNLSKAGDALPRPRPGAGLRHWTARHSDRKGWRRLVGLNASPEMLSVARGKHRFPVHARRGSAAIYAASISIAHFAASLPRVIRSPTCVPEPISRRAWRPFGGIWRLRAGSCLTHPIQRSGSSSGRRITGRQWWSTTILIPERGWTCRRRCATTPLPRSATKPGTSVRRSPVTRPFTRFLPQANHRVCAER